MQKKMFDSRNLGVGVLFIQIYILSEISAQTTRTLEIDADMEAKKLLKVKTTGTPNLITGTSGDLYVQDQLEVDGDLSVDGYILYVKASTNKVGINENNPNERLTIDGGLSMVEGSTIWEEDDFAKFYAKEGAGNTTEMYVVDGDGDHSLLSSHRDPALHDPTYQSSFSDPDVTLPFSFHHFNPYTGRGAVSDLSGVVKAVEVLTGRSFTVPYDLPPEEIRSVMRRYPGIEIPISEASELVEITEPGTVTEYVYDLETEQVTAVEVPSDDVPPVGTGVYEKRLKDGVWFDETAGKFYRERTPEEIEPGMTPDLPQWIIDRLPNE